MGLLNYFGGKARLAKRIAAIVQRANAWHYVEPFAGGLSVMLAMEPHATEVANDKWGIIANFWSVMSDAVAFEQFRRIVNCTPCGTVAFDSSLKSIQEVTSLPVISPSLAAAFFTVSRMSFGGNCATFRGLPLNRRSGGRNESVNAWLSAIDGLPGFHERMRGVQVFNEDAIKIIRRSDTAETVFYCDPPYLHETRTSDDDYRVEMTANEHSALLNNLASIKGRFVLSGYPSPMYDDHATRHGWHRQDFDVPNNAAGGASRRRMTECVWTNFKTI